MKANALIAALQRAVELHGDLDVAIDGCDCDGIAEGVVKDRGDFLIVRDRGAHEWDDADLI